MKSFHSIDSLIGEAECGSGEEFEHYRKIIRENKDLVNFLRFLEVANPCDQEYFLYKNTIIISYIMRYTFIKLGKNRVSWRFRIIGLPVSLSDPGYLTAKEDEKTRASISVILREIANRLKGTTIILNADNELSGNCRTLPTFVFYNRFAAFNEYLDALRSNYRRKIKSILVKGKELVFRKIKPGEFTKEHYELYLSVLNRASIVARVMPIEYFKSGGSEIFEATDKQGRLLAFIQLKELDGVLNFLYVGFRKNESRDLNTELQPVDLYFNLLLFIIRYGIENGYRKIVFGQTAGESKSKVGCKEETRYMYMTSSNPIIKGFLGLFRGIIALGTNETHYNVFKRIHEACDKAPQH
ncbi:MAG: hypothetical protein BWY11_00693 [Firmicutes bacterium ADurb.Bin182]|nr:MAG: hypothetical protein BWY11_00693 [Firmicutes bacterium ADurb.Bin182]